MLSWETERKKRGREEGVRGEEGETKREGVERRGGGGSLVGKKLGHQEGNGRYLE